MITKEDVKKMSDEEIMDMVSRAKGHTGKDFSELMGTEFSYSYLTDTLTSRGYRNGWYKPQATSPEVHDNTPELLDGVFDEESLIEKTFLVDKEIAGYWDEICENRTLSVLMINEAMLKMIEKADAGGIKFVISPAKSSRAKQE